MNPLRRTSAAARLAPSAWLTAIRLSACDRVGAGTRAVGVPLVHNEGRIEIGARVTLRSTSAPVRLVCRPAGLIQLGDGVTLDGGVHVFSERSVRIDDGVTIGPNAVLSDRDEEGRRGEIVVEGGARIGAGARIVGPCRIGRNAKVAAGSVVRGDVPSGGVVASNAHDPPPHPPAAPPSHPHSNGVAKANGIAARPVSGAAPRELRAILVADFTIQELAAHLEAPGDDGLVVTSEVAPFDQVVPTLIELQGRATKVDAAVVWTRPERACPSFQEVLLGGHVEADALLGEVDAFAALIRAHAGGARFVFVPTWTLPPWRRGMGLIELRGPRYASALLMRMNLRLVDALAPLANVFALDAPRWLAAATDGGVDPKLWHAGKVAFTTEVLVEAARDLRAALVGLHGMARKLVVVDLDDTLWGGIVGDVGWESLTLGGHDAAGEAFVEFQRQLIALTKRGIALAVVSKNEESTALEAMRSHPEMLIRPGMLAAYRINWSDKAQNVADIAQELNLGLQSVVFLDDNPIERGRVREALPEVYVPEWPLDPTHYPRALASLRCFDTPHVSAEDLERNAMYATERERTSLRSKVSSIDEWLATLALTIRFEPLGPSNLARAAQLLNKTNQMNLRTRRLSEGELLAWSQQPGHEVWAVHVADRFGQAGLTGLVGVAREGDDVHLADFVLSCRVMGRRVEESMVWAASRRAAALGGRRLVIVPIATAKNKPCLDFFARLTGLSPEGEGYVRAADAAEAAPGLIAIEGLDRGAPGGWS